MSESNRKVEDLLDRIAKTAGYRHKAGERLARHQQLSLWTLCYLALGLVFIPLVQALGIQTGISAAYLNAAESVLAILVLVYALLVGMEKFVTRTASACRGAIELERLARRVSTREPQKVTDTEYAAFAKEYYDIVERYESHQPVDRLLDKLGRLPRPSKDWPQYLGLWTQAQLLNVCNYIHYLLSLAFVAFVFITLLTGIGRHTNMNTNTTPALELRSSTELNDTTAAAAALAPTPVQ